MLQVASGAATTPLFSPRDALFVLVGILATVSVYVLQMTYSTKRRDAAHPRDAIDTRISAIENILRVVVKGTLNPEEFLVLLFGPGAPLETDAADEFHVRVWTIRTSLRAKLEKFSFVVAFGEDIEGATRNDQSLSLFNISVTEKALAARAGTIVILASSIGSAAELGIISQHQVLCAKAIIAVHQMQRGAFMLRGVSKEAELHGARLVFYEDEQLATQRLADTLFEEVLGRYEAALSRSLLTSPQRI